VASDFFAALGVAPDQGRTFSEAEEGSALPVIVLGHELWRRELGGAAVLGRSVLVNDVPYTVLGVLPEGFELPMQGVAPEAYIPLGHKDYGSSRSIRSLEALARLAPGATLEQASAELAALGARAAEAHPDTNRGYGAALQPPPGA